MDNFSTFMLGRKVDVSFDVDHYPNHVRASFPAQRTSFACQGEWYMETVLIPKNEFTLNALASKIESGFNVYYY